MRVSNGKSVGREVGKGEKKEDWMKRALFVVTVCLLVMLIFASVAFAQPTTQPVSYEGSPALLTPGAALLLGSGVLTYAIVRRRR